MESELVGVRKFNDEVVFAAALDAFWRQGPAATTMPDLAQATGVLRGSLYNAYGDRETIFLHAFDLYAKRFLAEVDASLEGDEAESILQRFFEVAIANMMDGTPARGCLTTKAAADGSAESEAIRKRLRGFLRMLASHIEAALARPDIRTRLTLDPAAAADLIVTFTRGLAVMERVHSDRRRMIESATNFIRALLVGKRSPARGTSAKSSGPGAKARGRRSGAPQPRRRSDPRA